MKSGLIVVEGIDASGKTTIAQALSKELSGEYYKTPPPCFKQQCIEMDRRGVVYDESRFLLYLEAVYFASGEIGRMMRDGCLVIVDRWIWTTLAYHFGHNPLLHQQWGNRWQDLLPQVVDANLSILLSVADERVWLKRIRARGIDKADGSLVENAELRKRIFRLYSILNPNFQIIDNGGSRDESLRAISALVKR